MDEQGRSLEVHRDHLIPQMKTLSTKALACKQDAPAPSCDVLLDVDFELVAAADDGSSREEHLEEHVKDLGREVGEVSRFTRGE